MTSLLQGFGAGRRHSRLDRGMTLIELMIALVIGLGVTLAVSSLVVVGENHKRTTTSTNDAEQTGAFAVYALDRIVRSAGSGFADSAYPTDQGVLGCKLNATAAGFIGLPRPAGQPFPPPFRVNFLGGAVNTLRVAPLLIGFNQSDNARSDVLVVMSGSGAAGGVPRQNTIPGTATSLTLDNTVGFADQDLAIVSQSGTPDCLLEQVLGNPVGAALPLGGAYYTAGSTTNIGTFAASTASYVTPIGNAGANNVQFQLLTVDSNRILNSYDLLQNIQVVQGGAADAVQAIADGVDQIHAIYGIDGLGTGKQSTWVSPGTAPYDINTVMTTPSVMRKIVSVRIALVIRGEYYDKKLGGVTPPTLTLFDNLTDSAGTALPALKQTVNLSLLDQQYRYRVFEFTVPLRNMLLLAQAP